MTPLDYSVVMPARNEEENLPRVAEWLVSQTRRPREWIIVDNGSTDGTIGLARDLARQYTWIRVLEIDGMPSPVRGAPIVRAFTAGLAELHSPPDVVVKLDADLSGDVDYFERLLSFFVEDPELGIAGGVCLEFDGNAWVETNATVGHVRGASRAYRWRCLQDVLPLEERMGWDGLDALKATTLGWRTATVPVPFQHHRSVGVRDRNELSRWFRAGEQTHYMNYRPSYALFRALRWTSKDWRALAMIAGYAHAVAAHRPQHPDPAVRALLRERQRMRNVPIRAAEALGHPRGR